MSNSAIARLFNTSGLSGCSFSNRLNAFDRGGRIFHAQLDDAQHVQSARRAGSLLSVLRQSASASCRRPCQ
jgi:hypothetical protein